MQNYPFIAFFDVKNTQLEVIYGLCISFVLRTVGGIGVVFAVADYYFTLHHLSPGNE